MRYILGFVFAQLAMTSSHAQSPGHSFLPVDDGSAVTNVATDSFDVSIDAASINTDNETRDEHLRKDSYFDVEKYPRIRFVASSVAVVDAGGHYRITGKLTIKGTTKEITFPFLATPAGSDYVFKGNFTINRRDFGVGGASTLSNDVTVTLTVVARQNP